MPMMLFIFNYFNACEQRPINDGFLQFSSSHAACARFHQSTPTQSLQYSLHQPDQQCSNRANCRNYTSIRYEQDDVGSLVPLTPHATVSRCEFSAHSYTSALPVSSSKYSLRHGDSPFLFAQSSGKQNRPGAYVLVGLLTYHSSVPSCSLEFCPAPLA